MALGCAHCPLVPSKTPPFEEFCLAGAQTSVGVRSAVRTPGGTSFVRVTAVPISCHPLRVPQVMFWSGACSQAQRPGEALELSAGLSFPEPRSLIAAQLGTDAVTSSQAQLKWNIPVHCAREQLPKLGQRSWRFSEPKIFLRAGFRKAEIFWGIKPQSVA